MNRFVKIVGAVFGVVLVLFATVSATWPTPSARPAKSKLFVITPSAEPATPTDAPPTATDVPPTATDVPPTATDVPPTATSTTELPTPTGTAEGLTSTPETPTATSTVEPSTPTGTIGAPTSTPETPSATAEPGLPTATTEPSPTASADASPTSEPTETAFPTATRRRSEPEGFADPMVTKTADRTSANVGDGINYRVTITNRGNRAATNVVLVDTLPPYLSLVWATASRGTVAINGQQITVTIGELAPGEATTVDVVASVTTTTGADIPNIARVSTDSPTNDPSNDQAAVVVLVTGEPASPSATTMAPSTGTPLPSATSTPPVGAETPTMVPATPTEPAATVEPATPTEPAATVEPVALTTPVATTVPPAVPEGDGNVATATPTQPRGTDLEGDEGDQNNEDGRRGGVEGDEGATDGMGGPPRGSATMPNTGTSNGAGAVTLLGFGLILLSVVLHVLTRRQRTQS